MIEEDAEFFPSPNFGADSVIESGQLVICEANLTHLEERIAEIEHRANYYNEYSLSKLDFLDMVRDLKARASAIRRSAK